MFLMNGIRWWPYLQIKRFVQTRQLVHFMCPSSPPDTETTGTLCYAANAGSGLERLTSTNTQAKGDGVFVSRVGKCILPQVAIWIQITAGDGTANTLMVTEKCGTAVSPQMPLFGVVEYSVLWQYSLGYEIQNAPKVVMLPWSDACNSCQFGS